MIAALDSGKALRTMENWVSAQGGDPDFTKLPTAPVQIPVRAERDGWIVRMDAEQVGVASSLLGAGRMTKDAPIDHAAGIVLEKKTGDYVCSGDVLAWLHTSEKTLLPAAEARFRSALQWGEAAPKQDRLIYDIVR